MDDKKEAKSANFPIYGRVLSFLCLEILAIVSFNLANSFTLFAILGIIFTITLLVLTAKRIKKESVWNFVIFLIPLILFGLMSAISPFAKDVNYSLGVMKYFIPIALSCFAAMGYLVTFTGVFKISKALYVIYAAMCVLTLINLFATLIQFSPFHTIIYSDRFLYYLGHPSSVPVGSMAYGLVGFSFNEISIQSFSLLPSILLTSFIPLFFMKLKENKFEFISYIVFGSIGAISLILTPNKFSLISDAFVIVTIILIVLTIKLKFKSIVPKLIAIISFSLIGVGFILVGINAQSFYGSSNVLSDLMHNITKNGILDRIFNSNSVVSKYNAIMDGVFTRIKFFGANTSELNSSFTRPLVDLADSSSLLFDTVLSSGVIGLLLFIGVVCLSFINLSKYMKLANDHIKDKALLFSFVLVSFIYSLVAFDMTPSVFSDRLYPFYISSIFLIILFLVGYSISKAKEGVTTNEEKVC